MSENDFPPGWAMPDDLAKKINEVLSNKPITPEDAVQNALDEIARDIALIEPDPDDWGWWVTYLLEQMEIHADKRKSINNYEQTLVGRVDKFQNRIKGGRL